MRHIQNGGMFTFSGAVPTLVHELAHLGTASAFVCLPTRKGSTLIKSARGTVGRCLVHPEIAQELSCSVASSRTSSCKVFIQPTQNPMRMRPLADFERERLVWAFCIGFIAVWLVLCSDLLCAVLLGLFPYGPFHALFVDLVDWLVYWLIGCFFLPLRWFCRLAHLNQRL